MLQNLENSTTNGHSQKAAHVFKNSYNPDGRAFTVRLGDYYNRGNETDCGTYNNDFHKENQRYSSVEHIHESRIKRVIKHPNYLEDTLDGTVKIKVNISESWMGFTGTGKAYNLIIFCNSTGKFPDGSGRKAPFFSIISRFKIYWRLLRFSPDTRFRLNRVCIPDSLL